VRVVPTTKTLACVEYVCRYLPVTEIAQVGITNINDDPVAMAAGVLVAVFVFCIRCRFVSSVVFSSGTLLVLCSS